MEKHHLAENLIQGGAIGGLDEKQMWKERLRKEILEEEKERIMNFVKSEVTKKVLEIEKLLEIRGKPAKLVLLPIDAPLPKFGLGLELGTSLSYQLVSTGTGSSSAPATLDAGVKGGSELGLGLAKDDSAENPRSPVKETKAEKQPLKEKNSECHLRPKKKQKTVGIWSCPLCGVTATSQGNLNNHFLGKKHKNKSIKVEKTLNSDPKGALAGKETFTNGLPMKVCANGKLYAVYKKGNRFWCNNKNCNFTCDDWVEMNNHLTGPEHEACENGGEGKSEG